jgi:GTP pyrophosphokinase
MGRSLLALVLLRVLALLVRSREDAKDLEIVVLRHQLQVLRRQVGRTRFRWSDRLFLAAASRHLAREHQVPLPPGGHPSQTDVWALARGADGLVSIATEGKVDETFGETVADILRDGSEGQHARLRHLCRVMGLAAPPATIRYPLLHRAVSALIEAERFGARHAVLLVQSFGAGDTGLEDFRAFAGALGAEAGIGRVVSTTVTDPARLWLAWVHMGPTDPVFMYVPEPGQLTPTTLTTRFAEALSYAFDAHWRQPRKGTQVPYVSHVLAVAALVLEDGGNETEAIAALLHDAVEDSGGPERATDIRSRFGNEVADIVDACSDTDVTPKPPWRDRKEAHLAHLRTAPEPARRVAAADKLHNLRAVLRDYRVEGEALWRRFNAGRDAILWYHREMLAVFESFGPRSLAAELRRTLTELETAIAATCDDTRAGGAPVEA